MSKRLEEIMKKAYETGALTDTEFRKAITDLFLEEYEYIIDTGNFENANAEFVLRLKGKHRKLHKIFWNDKFAENPKHYLKWEDLEFIRDEKVMTVKMGDTVYKVLYRCCDGIKEVQLLSEDEKFLYFNYIGNFKDNIQFFNDLHLERVEEWAD